MLSIDETQSQPTSPAVLRPAVAEALEVLWHAAESHPALLAEPEAAEGLQRLAGIARYHCEDHRWTYGTNPLTGEELGHYIQNFMDIGNAEPSWGGLTSYMKKEAVDFAAAIMPDTLDAFLLFLARAKRDHDEG